MLKGKNAIITGCNRGIGKAILYRFAENGANIWAHARRETPEFLEELAALREKTGVRITPIFFDITDQEAMREAVQTIRKTKEPVDILVNNAGISHSAMFQMSREETLREVFEVNYFSLFLFTQYIVKLMARQKSGAIVNIASIAAQDALAGKAMYGSAKAAVVSMSKAVAVEFGPMGIRCNCVLPGTIETDMIGYWPEDVRKETLERTPLRRSGTPEEVADAVTFLSSDRASFITGQTLRVDGGYGH